MFELEVAPRITKEFILSKISQEAIFEFYLGIPVKKGLFCSPSCIRVDKKPTCSFYKSGKGNLVYKDFAGPTLNCIDVVMHLYNCSFPKALKIIANDFNLVPNNKLEKNIPKREYSGYILKETEKSKIQVEIKEFSEKELLWWNSFGISLKTLTKFKVFSIKAVFLNGNYFMSSDDKCPVYGYYGGEDSEGDELWRLYMPSKIKYRFLSNWDGGSFQGSKQLPKEGDHCIISKSLKDVMVLFESGFVAISPTSENILITEGRYKRLEEKFKTVLIFFDNDSAGVKGAHKYKKAYPNSRCVFIKRRFSKDISDLYKKISRNQFWIVVDELKEIISNPDLRQTKHFYIF